MIASQPQLSKTCVDIKELFTRKLVIIEIVLIQEGRCVVATMCGEDNYIVVTSKYIDNNS